MISTINLQNILYCLSEWVNSFLIAIITLTSKAKNIHEIQPLLQSRDKRQLIKLSFIMIKTPLLYYFCIFAKVSHPEENIYSKPKKGILIKIKNVK